MHLSIEQIELPLKVVWKLSRNKAFKKQNFIVSIDNKFFAEVAPNIRYGETPELILEQFESFKNKKIDNLEETLFELKSSSYAHSLMFALEAVYVHYSAFKENKTVPQFLSLTPKKEVLTSFSVPIMPIEGIERYVLGVSNYPYLKVKVNSNMAIELVREVSKFFKLPLRIDGNEAWSSLESYLEFENKLQGINVEFIEQPFKAADKELYLKLKKVSKYPIIADESVEDVADFNELSKMFHGVNVKLMKAGGYYQAIKLLEDAKKAGLKTMIGCMVETSLGIQSAIYLTGLADFVDLDGFLLLQKDPYDLVSDNNGLLSLTNVN